MVKAKRRKQQSKQMGLGDRRGFDEYVGNVKPKKKRRL